LYIHAKSSQLPSANGLTIAKIEGYVRRVNEHGYAVKSQSQNEVEYQIIESKLKPASTFMLSSFGLQQIPTFKKIIQSPKSLQRMQYHVKDVAQFVLSSTVLTVANKPIFAKTVEQGLYKIHR
jgi:hypothetical protein